MDLDATRQALNRLSPERAQKTLRIAACAAFLVDSILPPRWKPSDELLDGVALTDLGEGLAAIAADRTGASPAEGKAAALIAFLTDDGLLVDESATDDDVVIAWLSREVREREVQFPWLLAGDVHRAYAAQIGRFATTLSVEETQALLASIPHGVFQYGVLVTGPFGLLQSPATRVIPPPRRISTFVCDVPGCTRDHRIELSTGETKTSEAFNAIAAEIRTAPLGARELIDSVVTVPEDVTMTRVPDNLLYLVGDAIADSELPALAALAFDSVPERLRNALIAGGRRRKAVAASSAAVLAESLSRAELLQLILLLENDEIARLLDNSTLRRALSIPGAEVRTPRTRLRISSVFGSQVALSRYGVRLGDPGLASLRLHQLVDFVHRHEGTEEDLAWRLRGTPGATMSERLQTRLHQLAPTEAIAELVLVSPRHAAAALRFPGLGSAEVYLDQPVEELRQVLEWKLGFHVTRRSDHLDHFVRRLSGFRSVAASVVASPSADEALKDRVRGEGVNFFVSVEQLLDLTLSFSTWALLHDHLAAAPSFTYNPRLAKQFMLNTLRGQPVSDAEVLSFPHGTNLAIGTLHDGFIALTNRLNSIENGQDEYQRTRVPDWVDRTPLLAFPFRHTQPFLDLSTRSRERIRRLLRDVPATLSAADVAGVRNRVDHWRQEADAGREFPTGADILDVCDAVKTLVDEVVSCGLCPAVLRRTAAVSDAFGRIRLEYADDFGRSVTLYTPNSLLRCGLPSSRTQVALSAAVLEGFDDCLRFRVVDGSPYTEMWKHFPPMRLAHPMEEIENEAARPSPTDDLSGE